eukprot:6187040-Pleurochrysis_carterae.AAC.2
MLRRAVGPVFSLDVKGHESNIVLLACKQVGDGIATREAKLFLNWEHGGAATNSAGRGGVEGVPMPTSVEALFAGLCRRLTGAAKEFAITDINQPLCRTFLANADSCKPFHVA